MILKPPGGLRQKELAQPKWRSCDENIDLGAPFEHGGASRAAKPLPMTAA
jgi:hypothetical protein